MKRPMSIGEIILQAIRAQQKAVQCELKQKPFRQINNDRISVLVCVN